MPLDFGTLKTSKKDFYRSEYQKRKDEFRPFSILAFLQPTTVDKEPDFIHNEGLRLDQVSMPCWLARLQKRFPH